MAALQPVPVETASPERFRPLLGDDDYTGILDAITAARRVLTGRVIWHVNSTAHGGGVAELLQSLLAYARGAGVDTRWMTISGNEDFFRVTKRIHNRLHGFPGDGGELGEAEHAIYEGTLAAAAAELGGLIQPGDIIYLHDPQTGGLVDAARATGAHVIWRCHIGLDRANELAREAWEFLKGYVKGADAYVFSRRAFAWEGLEEEKLWLIAPSIDAFSPKNQDLDPTVVAAILARVGIATGDHKPPVFTRMDGSQGRVDRPAEMDQDEPVPPDVPLVVQVSRWDRLKDPEGVLRCFADHLRNTDAHLLMAAPSVRGVTDDPEGAEVLEEVRAERAALPEELRARVHLASLPMDDVGENATIVNAIQRRADIVLQKSLAEGFGLTVAEAMWKGRPVVASRIGGIQDQVVDGESGVLIDDPRDLAAVAAAIDGLLGDPQRAEAIGVEARERVRRSFLGSRHLIQYMTLIERMLAGK